MSAQITPLGHLAHCEIEGLFGSRKIAFEAAVDGPTLLYGTNGAGKSTVLRLIDDVAHARWNTILVRPFAKITLRFRSGGRLVVSKDASGLVVVLNDVTWTATPEQIAEARRRLEFRRQRAVEAGRTTLENRQAALFDANDLDDDSRWILTIPKLFPVFLIEDQRLVAVSNAHRGPHRQAGLQAAVSRFASDLRTEIDQALGAYAAQSQTLDRLFPMKIARAVEASEASDDSNASSIDLRESLDEVQRERSELQTVGLLGREEGPVEFDAARLEAARLRPVIQTFAEDTLAKFSVLRDLRTRLQLFSTFLNQHYQGKMVETSREQGFVIRLDDGDVLHASQLSSGEQQMLALAFRILFRSQPGTLILIDEPELSLHVVWQSTLIEDLVAMGNARDVTFLLATHSPTLIGDRANLMRSLDEDEAPSRLADSSVPTSESLFDDGEDDISEFDADEDAE
ncbi:MAG TPA: AAA family ATPase [Solirubrobacteraceae bacterium]|nr:AAA family ATPase [Solirubrobacteraceae bacterium]